MKRQDWYFSIWGKNKPRESGAFFVSGHSRPSHSFRCNFKYIEEYERMSEKEGDLAKELLKLLKMNESERISRNRCFDRFATPFGRKLFSYYRTCISIKKEIEDERKTNQFHLRDGEVDGCFELEIVNKPVRYHRKTILPTAVRPYFESLLKSI